jgi:hypothetical protein
MAVSYKEILERREKRKSQELQFALRRPKLPANDPPTALAIMILQWAQDELYAGWRAKEIAKAQATKEVIKPKRARGGRRNSVLEQLGLA